MASIEKYIVDGYECSRLTDTSSGRRLQYAIKLDKFSKRQWLAAHGDVMRSLSPEDRQGIAGKKLKETVLAWLQTPKEGKASAKQTGIKLQAVEAKGEASIKKVADRYLLDFCQASIIDLVERRRVYFHVFHGIEMSEWNEAALYCFWIAKLQPFADVPPPNMKARQANDVNATIASRIFLPYPQPSTGDPP